MVERGIACIVDEDDFARGDRLPRQRTHELRDDGDRVVERHDNGGDTGDQGVARLPGLVT
jgi:hypothetical protein